jgi:alanine racemase
MRIKIEQGINGCQVTTDTYANDLTGVQAVLNFLARQNRLLSKTLIVTHLWQHDLEPGLLYHQFSQLLRVYGISKLIGIGQGWTTYRDSFKEINAHFYSDVTALLQSNLLINLQGSLVAIKGTQLDLTRIAQLLHQRCHSTVLEVDLDAIEHNLRFFLSKLAPTTQVVAMVKALAYGSSDCEVAQLLEHCQVDYLAVAYTDEGVALREQGITLPIIVMSPMSDSFHRLVSHQLEPVIYSLEVLSALQEFLVCEKTSMSVHLELETGMHRLGFGVQDIEALIYTLQATPAILPKTVMSHLAASGTSQHDDYSHTQAQLFQQLADHLESQLGIRLKKHLLSTAGILRFPGYQFDMVRLGIGLYGVGIEAAVQQHLRVAIRLKTTITQIKEIPANTTVGYERQGQVGESKTIATLAIGYADGFSRALGNGKGQVWINGQLAPVLGNVCMDMIMVDITHISAQPGDEAIIFGPEHGIDQVAASANTIAYELLTQVGERVRRVYYVG